METTKRRTLGVIIIARNERHNVGRCITSVAFADEVVVLDHASTDGTADLARLLGARVVTVADWPGFGPQKNRALALAESDWILSLDADEWVSEELAAEILAVLEAVAQTGEPAVYEMPRRSSYCGQFMAHGGWYPDYVQRLFPRGGACFSDDAVHERLLSRLSVHRLKCDLLHRSIPDFESVLDKLNRYSTGRAHDMHRRGRRGGLGVALGHGLWTFIRCYVLRGGFLDGRMGFVLAVSNAEGAYYRYLKLWLLEKQSRSDGHDR